MNEPIALVSMSGGKDSTATALLAIKAYGKSRVRLVFADTGHEHPLTYDYVFNYLAPALGVVIYVVRADFRKRMEGKRNFIATNWEADGVPPERISKAIEAIVPTGNPYLDLCLWKGRFPSRMAQFCTQELKSAPMDALIEQMFSDGHKVESWRGIRRDESQHRQDAKEIFIDGTKAGRAFYVVQPIVSWTAQQTVDFVVEAGIKLNPLYSQGMKRVGCMPCINCGKDELLEISKRWPEEIKRVASWEGKVSTASKQGASTFFADPDRSRAARGPSEYARIESRVEWSKTKRGGKIIDEERLEPPSMCSSLYGLCE